MIRLGRLKRSEIETEVLTGFPRNPAKGAVTAYLKRDTPVGGTLYREAGDRNG
jgi:hypothetical protein